MQEEDNYEYRYRIIYLEIQKKQRMKKIVKWICIKLDH
jgi:hypothetical protein